MASRLGCIILILVLLELIICDAFIFLNVGKEESTNARSGLKKDNRNPQLEVPGADRHHRKTKERFQVEPAHGSNLANLSPGSHYAYFGSISDNELRRLHQEEDRIAGMEINELAVLGNFRLRRDTEQKHVEKYEELGEVRHDRTEDSEWGTGRSRHGGGRGGRNREEWERGGRGNWNREGSQNGGRDNWNREGRQSGGRGNRNWEGGYGGGRGNWDREDIEGGRGNWNREGGLSGVKGNWNRQGHGARIGSLTKEVEKGGGRGHSNIEGSHDDARENKDREGGRGQMNEKRKGHGSNSDKEGGGRENRDKERGKERSKEARKEHGSNSEKERMKTEKTAAD